MECQGSLDKTAKNTHFRSYQVCDADLLATLTLAIDYIRKSHFDVFFMFWRINTYVYMTLWINFDRRLMAL